MTEETFNMLGEHIQFVGRKTCHLDLPGRWRPIVLENVWVCHLFLGFLGLTDLGGFPPAPKSCKMCFEIDLFPFPEYRKMM